MKNKDVVYFMHYRERKSIQDNSGKTLLTAQVTLL